MKRNGSTDFFEPKTVFPLRLVRYDALKGQNMNKSENQNTEDAEAYEAPRLEIVSLRGDEVLAGSCKDLSGAGPTLTCRDGQFGSTCASLGS